MYPNGASNIGNLLRLIQEDKNQAPAAQVPATDPNSPIRGVIQQPINAPNAPGSSQVVSNRPEGVLTQSPQSPGVVTAPTLPVAPAPAPGPQVSAPSQPARPVSSPSAAPAPSPFIGTRISSPAPNYKATPAPTQVLNSPSTNRTSSFNPARQVTSQRSNQGGLTGAVGSITGAAAATAKKNPESVSVTGEILPALFGGGLTNLATKLITTTLTPTLTKLIRSFGAGQTSKRA